MIDILEALGVAIAGTIALCLIVVTVHATVVTVTKKKPDFPNLGSGPMMVLPDVPLDTTELERDIREMIATEFDQLSGNRNPDDPEGSRLYSYWAMNAADRIRHPERYSGVAQGGENVLHAVSADGTRVPLVGPGPSGFDGMAHDSK